MCVSLSIKTSAVFNVFICTACGRRVCRPVPYATQSLGGPFNMLHLLSQPCCSTRVTSHSETHLVASRGWKAHKRRREEERERGREHTHLLSLIHTHAHTHASLPQCSKENLRQSGELFLIFSGWRLTVWQIKSWDLLQLCSNGNFVAMLDNIPFCHPLSSLTTTFLSLARWSLEREETMGSSVRFGDRGLRFDTFLLWLLFCLSLSTGLGLNFSWSSRLCNSATALMQPRLSSFLRISHLIVFKGNDRNMTPINCSSTLWEPPPHS